MPKGENPLDVTVARAQEIIDEKAKADAPIATYKNEPVQKGVGRFGPFIKWGGLFINVSKKYNFDNLSQSDIEALIEDKLQKNIDKVIHNWTEEGILVEKARWGRSVITKGKIKIELSKDVDASKMTLAEVQELIEKKRGLGMFVLAGAQDKVKSIRKEEFLTKEIAHLVVEAKKLGITAEQLKKLIERGYQL